MGELNNIVPKEKLFAQFCQSLTLLQILWRQRARLFNPKMIASVVFVLTITRFNHASGPLEFALKNETSERYLNKLPDVCAEQSIVEGGSYKVGPDSYDSIVVCENGYLMPHKNGSAFPLKWEDGNSFDNPNATMIAVALINNTRIDNWIDSRCDSDVQLSYYLESICAQRQIVLSSFELGFQTRFELVNTPYEFKPLYGSQAARSQLIDDWKNKSSRVYYSISLRGDHYLFAIGETLRESIFLHIDGEQFEPKEVNNVIVRALENSEFKSISMFTIDGNFNATWGICVSWYKVAQPPEIIDKQNTFQFVLACMDSFPLNKCVTLFDYFELMYTENDGQILRAGITGPGLEIIELMGSNSREAVNLTKSTNIGIPGLWFFELSQNGTAQNLIEQTPVLTTKVIPGQRTAATESGSFKHINLHLLICVLIVAFVRFFTMYDVENLVWWKAKKEYQFNYEH